MNPKPCASPRRILSRDLDGGRDPAPGSYPSALLKVPSWLALLSSGLSPSMCKCLGVSKPGAETHQDPEVWWQLASGLAGQYPPTRSTHRQFIGHRRWHWPSAPLHFIKEEAERKTNKRGPTGTTHVAQGSRGRLCPAVTPQ